MLAVGCLCQFMFQEWSLMMEKRCDLPRLKNRLIYFITVADNVQSSLILYSRSKYRHHTQCNRTLIETFDRKTAGPYLCWRFFAKQVDAPYGNYDLSIKIDGNKKGCIYNADKIKGLLEIINFKWFSRMDLRRGHQLAEKMIGLVSETSLGK